MTQPLIIDVHSHSQTLAWERAMADRGRFGPQFPPWSVSGLLAEMDAHGIAATVLSVPFDLTFAGDEAPAVARAINEEHARIKADHPGRFGAFAVVPAPDMDATLRELEYAIDVLGLDGVCTTSNISGAYMGDPSFDPWFAEMHRRGLVLFAHPARPAGYPDIGLHFSMIEFMAETTRMVANLVFSGAKARFSGISLISTHGGGTIPYLARRLAWLETQYGPGPDRTMLTEDEVIAGFASFYYDLTASTSAAQLDALLRLVPASKLMMGFDGPYMDARFIVPAIAQFDAYDGLDATQKTAIRAGNAQRLFPGLAATGG